MPLITVTAGIGCGTVDVAGKVAQRLGVELFDDERLQRVAVDMGFSAEDLKAFDQKAPGLLDRLFRRSPETYDELMASVIYEVARRGEGVIVGHGSSCFLRDFSCALHVRMRASLPFRAARVAARMHVDLKTATEIIARRDADLKGFLHYILKIEWNDPSLYDLVINVEKMGVDVAASMIVHLAESNAISECSLNALESMERLSLLKRVEAAVVKENINVQELQIEVPHPGVVRLTGLIDPMRTPAGVTEVIRKVPGVARVICEARRHPMAEL